LEGLPLSLKGEEPDLPAWKRHRPVGFKRRGDREPEIQAASIQLGSHRFFFYPHLLKYDPIQSRRSPPIASVCLEHCPAGAHLLEAEGAGPEPMDRLSLARRGVDHSKTGMGKHSEEGGIGEPQNNLKRHRIWRADFLDHPGKSAEQAGPNHWGVGMEGVALRELALKARHHVVSRQRTTVVEADTVANAKGPDEPIL
jgi:hypothetical protein